MTVHVHFYEACGLSIASDVPIAGLQPAADSGHADVTIAMEGSTAHSSADSRNSRLWYASPERDASGQPQMTIEVGECGYRLEYRDEATFLVDPRGQQVIARWPSSRSDVDAASYLTGSVLAFLLRVRGSVPLHASAVANDGRAILFVGDSWSGKSSTAAAFARLGYSLLSDDVVRIDGRGDELAAYPYQPRLNVWGDSAAALFGAADSDVYQKRYVNALDAGYRFQSTPVPIETVYVLCERAARRQRPRVARLTPRDALVALVRHTHGGSFLDRDMRARELEVIARLVEQGAVRELSFGDSLEDLVESCRALHL
jgi:hypothetical protein